jgi:hypothetical protein
MHVLHSELPVRPWINVILWHRDSEIGRLAESSPGADVFVDIQAGVAARTQNSSAEAIRFGRDRRRDSQQRRSWRRYWPVVLFTFTRLGGIHPDRPAAVSAHTGERRQIPSPACSLPASQSSQFGRVHI